MNYIKTDYTKDSDALPLYQRETPEQIEYKQNCFVILIKIICETIDFNSHMDIGCGCGHLVKAMRFCNKESYGADIGYMYNYGLFKDIKEYIHESSIFDIKETDNKYNLVSAMELLEHLYSEPYKSKELDTAIDNLVCLTNNYLIITVPVLTPEYCTWLNWEGRDPKEWSRILQIEEIPLNEDGTPNLGHVTLATEAWWRNKLSSHGLERMEKEENKINEMLSIKDKNLLVWWHIFLYKKS